MSNCTISNQTVGAVGSFDSVIGSTISNNGIGLVGDFGSVANSTVSNNTQTGLEVFGTSGKISWNKICNNGVYNIRNYVLFGQNINATDNYWGTSNETLIEQQIYDYYEDYKLSIVLFEPFVTSPSQVLPEFPSFLLLSLLITTTLLCVAYRRKNAPLNTTV
jgi:hypothetical protein